MTHHVLAFYLIVPIDDPKAEVKAQHAFCKNHDLTGRVYIAGHGINGQMSGTVEAAKAYMEWLKNRSPFQDVYFKIHTSCEHVFPRMTIKTRPKLVAIDLDIEWDNRGTPISPKRWRELLESEDRPPLLDVRNDYEWEIGRFTGAKKPPCNTFRDFEEWAENLEKECDKEKPVMMCCTGGIRCELFSSMLLKRGFKTVYQLEGGIIDYGLKEGGDHFEGKLFVFDDRLAIPIADAPVVTISKCHFCQSLSDTYYNCANMSCNELFIACRPCLEKHRGCCCSECMESDRLRPFHKEGPHKPFRRKHLCQTLSK